VPWLVLGFVFAFVLVVTALLGSARVGVEIALQLGRIPPAWLEPEPEPPVEHIEPDGHLIERVREREQLRRGF
jgi:mannose/fructose/N-acetylgalactosamine-specific phosphotransferase system component IIC